MAVEGICKPFSAVQGVLILSTTDKTNSINANTGAGELGPIKNKRMPL